MCFRFEISIWQVLFIDWAKDVQNHPMANHSMLIQEHAFLFPGVLLFGVDNDYIPPLGDISQDGVHFYYLGY